MMALMQSQIQTSSQEPTKTSAEKRGQASATASANGMTAKLLLELVTVVSQIARLDAMSGKMQSNSPSESAEAEKWHQVSVQALACSRKSLEDEQRSLLQRLAEEFEHGTPSACPASGYSSEADLTLSEHAVKCRPPPGLEDQEPIKRTQVYESLPSLPLKTLPPGLEILPMDPPPGLGETSPTSSGSGRWDCLAPGGCRSGGVSPSSISTAASSATFETFGEGGGSSLKADLETIKEYLPGSVLIVRKIKTLGFQSPEMLRKHFARYGAIIDVLVAHSTSKPSAKRVNGRTRPAALGFVVMGSVEEAEAALAAGMDQHVKGTDTTVEVKLFEGQHP